MFYTAIMTCLAGRFASLARPSPGFAGFFTGFHWHPSSIIAIDTPAYASADRELESTFSISLRNSSNDALFTVGNTRITRSRRGSI